MATLKLDRLERLLRKYGRDGFLACLAIAIVLGLFHRCSRASDLKSDHRASVSEVVPSNGGRYDHRAVTIPLGRIDVNNPMIREGQSVDLLVIKDSGKSMQEKTVGLFLEDLDVVSVLRPFENTDGILGGTRTLADPAQPGSEKGGRDEAGFVTLRVTSLEAMLVLYAEQSREFRVIPRVADAKSHLDFYDVLNVSRSNFEELAAKNLTQKPDGGRKGGARSTQP